jgi:hypothetical protein
VFWLHTIDDQAPRSTPVVFQINSTNARFSEQARLINGLAAIKLRKDNSSFFATLYHMSRDPVLGRDP